MSKAMFARNLVPFHQGNGTGGTHGTLLLPFTLFHLFRLFHSLYGTEQNKMSESVPMSMSVSGISVPSVPLVPHRGWNGTEQGRWFGPMFTSAAQPLNEKAVKASSLR